MRLQRVQDEKVVHVESAKRKRRKHDIGHVELSFAETVVRRHKKIFSRRINKFKNCR